MGYQQKLLLISSMFIVGIGIALGIQKFQSSNADANMNALMLDIMRIASRAQAYYFTPQYLNGGGRSFSGLANNPELFRILFGPPHTENGDFQILPSDNDQSIIIKATGRCDTDEDGQNFTVQVKVFPDSTETQVLNY